MKVAADADSTKFIIWMVGKSLKSIHRFFIIKFNFFVELYNYKYIWKYRLFIINPDKTILFLLNIYNFALNNSYLFYIL